MKAKQRPPNYLLDALLGHFGWIRWLWMGGERWVWFSDRIELAKNMKVGRPFAILYLPFASYMRGQVAQIFVSL